jgi:[acyl-carrier-protein] S-malonyltransferase
MQKTAFIFPGQGAQYVGMAREIIESDSETLKYLVDFRDRTGCDLQEIMLNGPLEKLKDTRITQPALLFHSLAALKIFSREISLQPDFVAGHSLGEFSALAANGVLSISDAMYLVHKRGEFMISAGEGKSYAMSAIIGLSSGEVNSICVEASQEGLVIAANYNTPVQTVISGSKEGVIAAMKLAEQRGAKRTVALEVGGAFHSPLVAAAADLLQDEMDNLTFNDCTIPLVSNVDAQSTTDIKTIKSNLVHQLTSPVRWVECVEYMAAQGVQLFIEFGPQKVLSGMLKKIDRNLISINIEKPEDLKKAVEYF